MSRSILVIGSPECCDYCPAGRIFGMAGQVECMAGKDIQVNNNGRIIPDWCTLRNLPGKMSMENQTFFDSSYISGRNDCIDEILKDAE